MDFDASIPMSSSTRTYDVHYRDWKTQITVNPSGTTQPVYTLNANCRSRQVTVVKDYDQQVGASKVHTMTMSQKVDVVMGNGTNAEASNTFEMSNDKYLVGSPRYTSPAFNNQQMTWKNKAMASNIIYTLIDGNGMAIAKFESSWRTKIGALEILDAIVGDEKMDEIMVTLLTLLRRKLQTIETSTIAAVT